jgi:hypothetical protein
MEFLVNRHDHERIYGDCICRWFVQTAPLLLYLAGQAGASSVGVGLFQLFGFVSCSVRFSSFVVSSF